MKWNVMEWECWMNQWLVSEWNEFGDWEVNFVILINECDQLETDVMMNSSQINLTHTWDGHNS